MTRLLQLAMFCLLCVSIAACSSSTPTPKVGGEVSAKIAAPVDIGSLLFTVADWPAIEENAAASADPIRVPLCLLTVLDKVEVPSKEEGSIAWIGVEVKPEEKIDRKDIHVHERTGKSYRRLRVGERVAKGQVIALLNDERAKLEHEIAISNIEGAKEELKAAEKGVKFYEINVAIEIKAKSSELGIVSAQATLAKGIAEEAGKRWAVERSKGEEKKALEKLNNHLIRAPITGDVVQFVKQVGEGVKATEPIMQLQNTDRLGVEGYLGVQYAHKVTAGSEVFLEPAILDPPLPLRSPHTSSKPITAVAVGMHQGKQVIISGSEDGSVHVWDRTGVLTSWKHKEAVRTIVCTRPEVENSQVLTGCDDGKARIWSLSELGKEPLVTLDGRHEGGVQAAAFSPDGTTCVTADDRGEISVWESATGKKRYAFPHEHNSAVTMLHFTPQCRVVSVGKDNAAFVWKVGGKSAAVETTFDHRSGEVGALGVSDDGGQMLLDLDKNRLRIVDLSKNHNLGTLQQSGEGGKFAAFALFSPSIGGKAGNRVLLTAGGADGVLQVWRWNMGSGRGAELRKLVSNNYVGVTCAAFSPLAKDGFIVAGTKKGDVHLWPMPTEEELAGRYVAKITHVAENYESSGKTVRIFAEYQNPTDPHSRLRPGTTATVVIPQK